MAVLAILIGFAAYAGYFRDIFRGTTKPHPFSWFVWGLLTVIVFFAQVTEGAGAGAWVTAVTALVCFVISSFGLREGLKNITAIDWICFISAIAAVILWQLTDNPLSAVIIVTLADMLAFVPTVRKAYGKPDEETAITFGLNGLKFIVALAALQTLSLTTVLYPASWVIANLAFVLMLLIRRRQMSTGTSK